MSTTVIDPTQTSEVRARLPGSSEPMQPGFGSNELLTEVGAESPTLLDRVSPMFQTVGQVIRSSFGGRMDQDGGNRFGPSDPKLGRMEETLFSEKPAKLERAPGSREEFEAESQRERVAQAREDRCESFKCAPHPAGSLQDGGTTGAPLGRAHVFADQARWEQAQAELVAPGEEPRRADQQPRRTVPRQTTHKRRDSAPHTTKQSSDARWREQLLELQTESERATTGPALGHAGFR